MELFEYNPIAGKEGKKEEGTTQDEVK